MAVLNRGCLHVGDADKIQAFTAVIESDVGSSESRACALNNRANVYVDRGEHNHAIRARTEVLAPCQGRSEGLDVGLLVESLMKNGEPAIYRKVSRAMDRAVLRTVLRAVKGNQVRASELLGISRTTLRAKLRSLGMAIEKQLLAIGNAGLSVVAASVRSCRNHSRLQ
jgi:DNA-binding NtrC family response regulator